MACDRKNSKDNCLNMTEKWNSKWKSSKRPSKQRLYIFNAPLHIKSKLIKSHLSKELRKKYSSRSVRVRKGDKVKIMIGDFKGKTGIIEKIDIKKLKIYVQGIEITKKDGGKVLLPLNPSNLLVQELNLLDKRRLENQSQHKLSGAEK